MGTLPAPPMVFPVVGSISYVDTFGAPRDGGKRRHAGIDIFGDRGLPIVAIAGGVVEQVSEGALAGQYVIVLHDNGWRSKYLHLNDDSPGTDDGLASGYAEGIEVGMRVRAGTVVGYLGDSGNAESTAPHLHFSLHQPNGLPINPYKALLRAPLVDIPYDFWGRPHSPSTLKVQTLNTELVGHIDPDGAGMNADLTVRGRHVFMGTSGQPGACPGTGVRVIDVSLPTHPSTVARFADGAEFPGTAADALWVGKVETPEFEGRQAIVGLRLCDHNEWSRESAEFAGYAIYDVTDPRHPQLLSTVHTGEGTLGAHYLDVFTDEDGLLIAASVPGSHLHDPDGRGGVRIYDATNPRKVRELGDWDLRSEGPLIVVEGLKARVGDEAMATKGLTWVDADTIAVAHSTVGIVLLDVSSPSRPRYVGTASTYDTYDLVFGSSSADGYRNNADGGWVLGTRTLVQDNGLYEPLPDESGQPGEWGQQTFYDIRQLSAPTVSSTFGTENSQAGVDGEVGRDGFYSANSSVAVDKHTELVAWASDGVRLVDLEDPTRPSEIAFFVPAPRRDPQDRLVAPDGNRSFPMVRDVATDGVLVYASDVNSGLWIFRVLPPTPFGSDPALD